MFQYFTLTLKSHTIHVIEKTGNGKVLLFLHGNSMSSRIWEKQMKDDVFAGFRLIAIDLPGHGRSTNSNNPNVDYSLPGYGNILLEVLESLKLEDFIFIGFSLGGNIALEVLPELKGCKGLFLSSTVLFESASDLENALMPHPAVSYIFKADTTKEQVAQAVELFFNVGTAADKALYVDEFMNTDPHCRLFLSKSIEEERLSSNVEKIKLTSIPIAYLTGANDQYLNLAYLHSHSLSFWEGIKLVHNAGHVPQTESPFHFNEQLLKFILFCFDPYAVT